MSAFGRLVMTGSSLVLRPLFPGDEARMQEISVGGRGGEQPWVAAALSTPSSTTSGRRIAFAWFFLFDRIVCLLPFSDSPSGFLNLHQLGVRLPLHQAARLDLVPPALMHGSHCRKVTPFRDRITPWK